MLGSGRFLYKQVDSIPKVFNAKPKVRHCSGEVRKKIIIPPRIERGPTDILQALASTVSLDPTAFHYRYPDDPFFYSYTRSDRAAFALSMESGRKSAKYIIKENPGFFKHQLADPPIEAFLQKVDSTDETEESLLSAIEERNVLTAIKIYKALKANNQDVGSFTKQSLLELVCFYNAEEKPDMELESKWFQGLLGKADGNKSDKIKWDGAGFTEGLFEEMNQDCPLAISAMIQGRLKYKEFKSALELYKAAKEKNIKLSVGVYNSLLSEALQIVKKKEKICDFVLGTLKEMSTQNIRPNLGTLNAALKAFSNTVHATTVKKLMSEFTLLGIQPSLGSYDYLLQIFSQSGNSNRELLVEQLADEILDKIENEEHEIRHPSDLDFFWSAMTVFSERLRDCRLALRLHEIFLKPGNAKFLARGLSEYIYYKQFFLSVFESKPIDFSMDLYRRYVFTCFFPDLSVMMAIMNAIHENLMPEYLVEFWEDCGKMAYSKSRALLTRILDMMEDFTDEASMKVFYEAAINYLQKINHIKPGDEDTFPYILLAFTKNKDEKKILTVMNVMEKNGIYVKNMPESTAEAIMDFAISEKSVPLILGTLRLAEQQDLSSIGELAEKCLPLLSGGDEAWVNTLISQHKERGRKTKEEEKDV